MSMVEENMKVSVVIPVYNVASYLAQCLDSLCAQTLKELQIICVDDGSTDGSLEILFDYEKRDPRFLILENNTKSAGAGRARNMGMAHAKGEYLLILDADDYFDLELIEKTYTKAKETDSDVVLFDAQYFDHATGDFLTFNDTLVVSLLPDKEVFSSQEMATTLFQAIQASAWKQLYRREFVRQQGLYFKELYVMNDIFFTYTSLVAAQRISVVPQRLLYYRYNNSSSIIGNLDREPLAPVKFANAMKEWLCERDVFHLFEESFTLKVLDISKWYLENLKEYQNYQQFYQVLQESALPELGDLETMPSLPTALVSWAEKVKTQALPQFLYEGYVNQEVVRTGYLKYPFPQEAIKKQDKVILYGSGAVGNSFYAQNLLCHHCNIVAWVDRNYEVLGFPVTGLETFQSVSYDWVVIAVERQTVAESIKKELLALGVLEEKMLWENPLV